ncbi:BURP domain-containing protein [Senna tora]|uniref:BURP domain-containing protein n=1 Tax=Senna tora TaxID=362788 RepID=A0A834T6S7_9FABA|nr:BURP domain-containing protein [Senna tora]
MKALQEQAEEKATQISTVNTHRSNQPYLDGWYKNMNTQEKGKSIPKSYQNYLDGWYKNTQKKGKNKNSYQPYLDGWYRNTQEEGQTENSNQPYLDGWSYPYAFYYCHYLDIGSKVFKVLLGGQYGEKMDALDTSNMDPNHILFRQLGMKPGEAPLCHFFPILHLLWVPLPPKDTM